ncbi:MAG: zinc-dependent alcohol dehydrogenase [Micromonosporaceae bacterium]
MRTARLHAVGDLRVGQEAAPAAEPGTSLVRVTAVGICGSDLHWWTEAGIGDARLDRPLVLGHEAAGVIEDGPRRGERVAIDPAIPCGTCPPCRDGYRNLCTRIRFAGHSDTDGALREFLTWPSDRLHALPDKLSDADGAVLEPLGVAIHALDLSHMRLGAAAAVVGCGPIGLLLVQLLRVAGARRVVAMDPLPHRREAAAKLGADVTIDPAAADGLANLTDAVGDGADAAFELAGNDDAVGLAIHAARPGGRVMLGGIPGDDSTRFPASVARRKGLTIAMVRRMNEVYPRAIDLAARGRVDTAAVVSDRFPLSRAAEAFDVAARRRGLKVIVEPGA